MVDLGACCKGTTLALSLCWLLSRDHPASFFCISGECPGTPKGLALLVCSERLHRAQAIFEQHQVVGSDDKFVRAEDVFKVIGAEVNCSQHALGSGIVSVSAPVAKHVALASLSLRVAHLPCISRCLASRLAGSWISALMFRRPDLCPRPDLPVWQLLS